MAMNKPGGPHPARPASRPAVGLGAADAGPQDIAVLRQRHESLSRARTIAETDLKHARAKLEELQAMAREQYGTDDLETLRQKLAQLREENERRRAAYQASLDRIQADLREVEAQYERTMQSGEADQ